MKPILSFMMAIEGKRLNDAEKFLLAKYNPAGISLFARNIENKLQLKSLLDEIKTILERDDVLIAVDQEGGRVRRLSEPNWRPYAPQYALNEQSSAYHAELIAFDLKEVGINLDYAPVADVIFADTTLSLKSRCFKGDEKRVAELGKIIIDEFLKNGVCPCIKHMPGHGRANVDPHLDLPILDFSLKELEKDFYPFKALNYSPAGMTAHVIIPEIDDKEPITQSTKGISTIIRSMIGFDGLLISDALDMKALKGTFAEKAPKCLDAGCDVVCYYAFEQTENVVSGCRILEGKSLERFEKISKVISKPCLVKNADEIAKKYYDLVGDVAKYKEEYDATETLIKMKK